MGRTIEEKKDVPYPEFRDRIQEKMKENNLKGPTDLSRFLGIDDSVCGKWYHGQTIPQKLEHWQALTERFKTTADFFLFGSQDERLVLAIKEEQVMEDGLPVFIQKLKPIRVKGRHGIQSIRIENISPNITRWIAFDGIE